MTVVPLCEYANTDLEQELQRTQAELERIRAAADMDLQNMTSNLLAKDREIGRLKAQLEKQAVQDPDAGPIKDLLVFYKLELGKSSRFDIKPAGKRWKLADAALKRWGEERCRHAIIGLRLKPWSGPRGRSAEQYPGSQRYDDVEHVFGDEVRFERCERVWEEQFQPSFDTEVIEVPDVGGGADSRDARLGPVAGTHVSVRVSATPSARQERPWPELCPWDKIIDRLRGLDRKIVTSGNPDQIMAQCPAHDDNHPSLAVGRKPDGTVGLHCFGPCKTEDVLAVLGLEWRDLWDGSERDLWAEDHWKRGKRRLPAHLRHAMRQLVEWEAA
jgi:hypothetical protein